MGYWATYIGEQIAISNAFGVWFEIERTPQGHRAVRLACPELQLKDWAVDSIDYNALRQTSAPIQGQPPTPTTEPPQTQRLSMTARGHSRGRRPRGTGDNPFTFNDLEEEEDAPKKKNG